MEKVFLPIDPNTAYVAYRGHLVGYDADYYGYAWADTIAADMATVFENAPNGFLDKSAGMKLRQEIYAPGGSRDIDVSIHNFHSRDRSVQPFLKTLGIKVPAKAEAGPSQCISLCLDPSAFVTRFRVVPELFVIPAALIVNTLTESATVGVIVNALAPESKMIPVNLGR